MCRDRVVGMTRAMSRDRLPRWKSRWWVPSHSVQEVVLCSMARPTTPPGGAAWRGARVEKNSLVDISVEDDILVLDNFHCAGH